MSFLTPLFFLGALALAVPIVVHLTNREKKEVVEFPSLMFLRRIPYRSVRRQKLRHLLLFALRCLALILLVAAFARPFFETPVTATTSSLGPQEVVFVLDHSYSMGYGDRFTRAKNEIRSELSKLGPDDRASVVLFSDKAEILNEPTSDSAEVAAVVDAVELSARTTRYAPALKLAKKVVDESPLARKKVALVSDFQRLGWEGDEDVWLPAGTELAYKNVGRDAPDNVTVTSVILERTVSGGRERLKASARITYKAPADRPPIETHAEIEIDTRSLQSKKLSLEPNSSTTVEFESFTLPSGISRGTIRLDPDNLEADNAFHFVLWPGQSLKVLAVERQRRQSFYVARALALGDRPSFDLETKRSGPLRASDLEGRDVVLLNDIPSLSASEAKILTEFVSEGGGLVVVLGAASGRNSFSGEAAKLLPRPPGSATDRSRDWGGTLSYLDYQSPVFDIFSAPHSGDFSSAKFFRYRTFDGPVESGVLARFDDGAIALAEKRIGEGRVLVWTSTLDTFWNDLARQPVFLPFVHQLVKYAAGYAEVEAWQSVGDVLDLDRYLEVGGESEDGPRGVDLVVSSPSGKRIIIPPSEERALLPITEQGFYALRRAGSGAGPPPLSLAANLDSTESDLATLDPEELVASVTFREPASSGEGSTGDAPAEHERRQGFWWYLLVAAFVLLATETIVSNRLSRASTLWGRTP